MAAHDADFAEFVQRSSVDLLRFAWRLSGQRESAEDLVQEALQRVYLRWGAVHGSPHAYARKAIVNRHVDLLRRQKIVRFVPFHTPYGEPAAPSAASDLRLSVFAEVSRLAARERTVVSLRYICDLPEKEVAELMGIRVGTVKSAASRGLAKLRLALADTERV